METLPATILLITVNYSLCGHIPRPTKQAAYHYRFNVDELIVTSFPLKDLYTFEILKSTLKEK